MPPCGGGLGVNLLLRTRKIYFEDLERYETLWFLFEVDVA